MMSPTLRAVLADLQHNHDLAVAQAHAHAAHFVAVDEIILALRYSGHSAKVETSVDARGAEIVAFTNADPDALAGIFARLQAEAELMSHKDTAHATTSLYRVRHRGIEIAVVGHVLAEQRAA